MCCWIRNEVVKLVDNNFKKLLKRKQKYFKKMALKLFCYFLLSISALQYYYLLIFFFFIYLQTKPLYD